MSSSCTTIYKIEFQQPKEGDSFESPSFFSVNRLGLLIFNSLCRDL